MVNLLEKNPELSENEEVIATEYLSENDLIKYHRISFKDNVGYLKDKNIDVYCEVDATEIGSLFQGYHFQKIHFNFPYCDTKDTRIYNRVENIDFRDQCNRDLMHNFFRQAAMLQQPGDRVYMALPGGKLTEKMIDIRQGDVKEAHDYDMRRRQGMVYDIYSAITRAGYKYVQKKSFDYSYGPVSTKGDEFDEQLAQGSREYVFEKRAESFELPTSEQVEFLKDISDDDFLRLNRELIMDYGRPISRSMSGFQYKIENKWYEGETNRADVEDFLFREPGEEFDTYYPLPEMSTDDEDSSEMDKVVERPSLGVCKCFLTNLIDDVWKSSAVNMDGITSLEDCKDRCCESEELWNKVVKSGDGVMWSWNAGDYNICKSNEYFDSDGYSKKYEESQDATEY